MKEKYDSSKDRLKDSIREINPATNNLWSRGEVCETRGIFWEYQRRIKKDQTYQMTFFKTFERYHHERMKTIFMKRKIYARNNNLDFNLTSEYLTDIFPSDFICPVLGLKLEWGHIKNGPSNPSLDRIIPSKGYVVGNVIWMSYRANMLKNDASKEEIQKILDFFSKHNL